MLLEQKTSTDIISHIGQQSIRVKPEILTYADIQLSADDSGTMKPIPDSLSVVPTTLTPRIQKLHIPFDHIIFPLVAENISAS